MNSEIRGMFYYYYLVFRIAVLYKSVNLWNRFVRCFLIQERRYPLIPKRIDGKFYSYSDMKIIHSFLEKRR